MKRILVTVFTVITLATTVHAASETAQSLYLQAGKEERSGNQTKARETYEKIIDNFPETEFAVKANDRLLALPNTRQRAVETVPAESPLSLLNPAPAKPLPLSPTLRKWVEAVRLKAEAETVSREEYERLKRVDEARDGHKLTRAKIADKEKSWEKGAADKVVKELGSTLEEIAARAETACREAGVKGECNEESLNRLSVAP